MANILKTILGAAAGAVTGGPVGVLAAVAPTIAQAMGGPLKDMALKFVADKLDLADPTEAAVEKALASDPAALATVKAAELDFKKHLDDNGIELERIHANDRANARQREITTGDHWTPRAIALVVLGMWCWTNYTVISIGVPGDVPDVVLGRILGMIDAASLMAMAYYLGSSAGSRQKTDVMARR